MLGPKMAGTREDLLDSPKGEIRPPTTVFVGATAVTLLFYLTHRFGHPKDMLIPVSMDS